MPQPSSALTQAETDKLRRLVADYGVSGAARMLGAGREVVTRALAGLPIRRGSVLLIGAALGAMPSGEGEHAAAE